MNRQFIGISWLVSALVVAATSAAPTQGDDQLGDAQPVVTVRANYIVNEGDHTGTLSITATVRDGYHIYAMTQPKPFLATEIHIDPSEQVAVAETFTPSRAPTILREDLIDAELHEYEGSITWTAPLKFMGDTNPRTLKITGTLSAQACYDQGCLPPKTYAFRAEFQPPPMSAATIATTHEQDIEQDAALVDLQRSASMAKSPPRLDFDAIEVENGSSTNLPLLLVLPMAFAAGFLLNFMPCVLPVIGLKIMAFAQQAGDRRSRILALNLWYSLGLVSVFLVLATLAAFLGLGWGQQFSSVTFNVVLAAVVFVFGLSFLGVWEIPIPGFVGSGASNELAQREGAVGAFSKGVLTTVLATPCSGPLLGSALTWAVTQSPLLTYLVFTFVGLGMASPYLLVGAFPKLIAFLPRPGEWMNTFKHLMGFVLLATVAYLLSFMPIPYVVPTITFMIGLGAACWWIGHTVESESRHRKATHWIQAAVLTVAVGLLSFGWLHSVMSDRFQRAVERELSDRETAAVSTAARGPSDTLDLPWQAYSHDLLAQLTGEGKAVLVDFTADWCLTCKANEAVALNQAETRDFIAANGIFMLRADKTRPAPEVDALLRQLGNKAGSIPFYAVFPAGNPNKPIVLDGMFTSPQPILDALRKAVSSPRDM